MSKNLNKDIVNKIDLSLERFLRGELDLHLVESGVSVFIDQNKATATKPKTRAVVAMNPTASVLIKKKAFSTFKSTNDLRWMDKTEKMLLRATKSLFALKVSQIQAYESLTKLDKFYDETGDLDFKILADLILSSKYLNVKKYNGDAILNALISFGASAGIASSIEDVIKIARRSAFSKPNTKTTWIVDPDDVQNYGTGPGTGVIELCTFTNISTSTGISSEPKSASISILDPYRIMNITEDDIEISIEESLYGTLGLLNDLAYGSLGGEYIDTTLIASSALEVFGLGKLDSTIDVDYIRDRLRTFYLGKWMINVNDGVHIYIASNKSSTSNSHMDNDSFDTRVDQSYFKIDEVMLEAERKLYTNQRISSGLYKEIRSKANDSFTMQHVFGGYVKGVSESYSPDKTILSISCQDNMGWLNNTRYMEEPGLMDPRAPLEDPITPYDLRSRSSDSKFKSNSLELLPENKFLLSSGLLSFNNGFLNGYNANESNIYQGNYSGPGSAYGSQIVQHPSGLVYRWRTGVLSITSPYSPNAPVGSGIANSSSQSFRQNYGFSVTNSIVANLDVANVISVMVTGQPYNVETFTQLAFDSMNVVRNGNSLNPNEALSFVLDSIRKQNSFYGNFKPFRMITMSEKTINTLASESLDFQDARNKVSILRKRKNEINRKIRVLGQSDEAKRQNASIIGLLEQEKRSIDLSIQKQIEATYRNNGLDGRKSSGINSSDLLDINFNIFGQNKVLKNNGAVESDHDLTRAMMKVATMRRIEDVKLNRDQNLLIVSDQYDLNPEIKANILSLRTSGFKLFTGNYMKVYDRCTEAANLTMMEFFCNTQGHLEIRPPLYNKTPLSVINGLYNYQKITGKKIVPDFLFTMLTDRISSLKLEIHATNVKIAILALMLGKYPDSNLIPGVPATGRGSLKFFGVAAGSTDNISNASISDLSFDIGGEGGHKLEFNNASVSDNHSNYLYLDLGSKEDGDILLGNTDLQIGNLDELVRELGTVSEPDYNVQSVTGSDNIYDKVLSSAIKISSGFNINGQIKDNKNEELIKELGSLGSPLDIVNGINNIRKNFREESGIDPASGIKTSGDNGDFSEKDMVFSSTLDPNSGIIESRVDEIFSKLNQSISNRNSLISILKKNQEKEEELSRIEQDIQNEFSENNVDFWEDPDVAERVDNIYGNKKSPNFFSNFIKDSYSVGRYTKRAIDSTRQFLSGGANKGTLFDHLIDDDTRNLTGPGSGRRFVIYDEFIKGYDVREQEPETTRVDIFGSTPLINDQMKGITGGENLTQWAGAVDYDLWRQYGYKNNKAINDAPFISDPETQGKPLALQQLAIQRAVIFSGTIQLAGNEYYQPGDTVYIPSKGLLFYVHTVSHTFGYGSSFDTTLTLMYGHPPGTYLPTPMDVIGQTYSKDSLKHGSYFVNRSNKGDDKYRELQPDCTLRFPKYPKITSSNIEYLLSHKNNMVKFYNMITDVSNGLLTSNRVLLIRGFIKESEESSEVLNYMSIVSDLFQNPVMLTQKISDSQDLSSAVGDDLLADSLQATQSLFNINAGSGLNKELSTIFLPNGAPVTKVTKDQILFQLVNLKRDSEGSTLSTAKSEEFRCFSQIALDKIGSIKDADGATKNSFASATSSLYDKIGLPRGGPSQSTWLEMEDLIQNVSGLITGDYEKIIEIGILELDSASVKLLMSLK